MFTTNCEILKVPRIAIVFHGKTLPSSHIIKLYGCLTQRGWVADLVSEVSPAECYDEYDLFFLTSSAIEERHDFWQRCIASGKVLVYFGEDRWPQSGESEGLLKERIAWLIEPLGRIEFSCGELGEGKVLHFKQGLEHVLGGELGGEIIEHLLSSIVFSDFPEMKSALWPENRQCAFVCTVACEANLEAMNKLKDLLDEFRLKATLAIAGNELPQYEYALKKLAEEGNEVATHTYTHYIPLTSYSKGELHKELMKCTNLLGYPIRGIIPPYEAVSESVIEQLIDKGLSWVVFYSGTDYPVPIRSSREAKFYLLPHSPVIGDHETPWDEDEGSVLSHYLSFFQELRVKKALIMPTWHAHSLLGRIKYTFSRDMLIARLLKRSLKPGQSSYRIDKFGGQEPSIYHDFLREVTKREDVWLATASEIEQWWEARSQTTLKMKQDGERLKLEAQNNPKGLAISLHPHPWVEFTNNHTTTKSLPKVEASGTTLSYSSEGRVVEYDPLKTYTMVMPEEGGEIDLECTQFPERCIELKIFEPPQRCVTNENIKLKTTLVLINHSGETVREVKVKIPAKPEPLGVSVPGITAKFSSGELELYFDQLQLGVKVVNVVWEMPPVVARYMKERREIIIENQSRVNLQRVRVEVKSPYKTFLYFRVLKGVRLLRLYAGVNPVPSFNLGKGKLIFDLENVAARGNYRVSIAHLPRLYGKLLLRQCKLRFKRDSMVTIIR